MNPAQQNFITRVGQQARRAHDLYALSEELDTLFNGTPNYSALITQNEIDSVPSFQQAGITVA